MSEQEEDFGAMFEASVKARQFGRGQTIEGTIVAFGADVAFVNVGGKGEAEIDLAELKDADGNVEVAVGDRIQAMVVSTSGVIRPDGTFSIPRLAPGRYVLRAAAPSATDMPETLSGEVTLNGADVSGVLLQPVRLATITGHITFEPPALPPAPSAIRVTVEPKQAELMEFFPARGSFGVADDFTFAITAAPGATDSAGPRGPSGVTARHAPSSITRHAPSNARAAPRLVEPRTVRYPID